MIDVNQIEYEVINGKTRYTYELSPGAKISSESLFELFTVLINYSSGGENYE